MAIQTSTAIQLQDVSAVNIPVNPPNPREGLRAGETDVSPGASQSSLQEETSPKIWLSVMGAFLFLFPSYGLMQTIGTIQSYLQLNQLSSYSSEHVGWITGVFTSLAFIVGLQIGPLFDGYGPKLLGSIGCAIYIPMLFVLAECHEYWQFMLVLGLWGAAGAGVVSTVGIAVIGRWFTRRRGLAMGLALCGSSTGGVVMPLMLRRIFPTLGWTLSIRILACVLSASLVAGALCLQQPLPERQGFEASERAQASRRKSVLVDFAALTSVTFLLVTIGVCTLEFAISGVSSLLPSYATAAHFGSDTGFNLIAITNAMSTFGRLFPGLAGDHFGHFNVLLVMILFTAIVTSAILVPFGSNSLGALYAFSALWGLGSGSFISLSPVCMGKTCQADEYGRYFGTMYFFASFALLLASPLGGRMLQTFGTQSLSCLYVAVIVAGGICFLFARQSLYRKNLVIGGRI